MTIIWKYLSLLVIFIPAVYTQSECRWMTSFCKILQCTNLTLDQVEDELHNLIYDDDCLKLEILRSDLPAITNVTLAVHNPEKYEQIRLVGNGIASIEEDSFNRFITLKNLSIADNMLESVRLENCMEMLEVLDLSRNQIKSLQGSDLPKLTNLTILRLQYNELTSFETLLCNFEQLTELYAQNNNLTSIAGYFECNQKLKIVNLENNKIKEISSGTFSNTPNLDSLLLENNQISVLDKRVFESLHNLPGLSLRNNRIRIVNSLTFVGLYNLKYLFLDNNDLQEIEPYSFFDIEDQMASKGLPKLMRLSITDNNLTKINSQALLGLSPLEQLDLSENQIFLASHLFARQNNLLYLNLSDNRINHIPLDAFAGLNNLTKLQLRNCSIRSIAIGAFYHLDDLSMLDLSMNYIEEIVFEVFVGMPQLEELDLYNNQINNIESNSFSELAQLKVLNLSGNAIFKLHIDTFQGLEKISNIDLRSLDIGIISPGAFDGLDNTTEIDLSDNNIQIVEANTFGNLSKLLKLILKDNLISSVEDNAFYGLDNLELLNIRNNSMQTITMKAFAGLSNLRHLDLSDSMIHSIAPRAFIGLGELRELHLSFNKIKRLQTESFLGLPNLQNLFLDETNLAEIDAYCFQGLGNVGTFTMYRNKISLLKNNSFFGLRSISWLDLNNMGIETIEPGAFNGLDRLSNLKLLHNNIKELRANTFIGLKNLGDISLSLNMAVIHSHAFDGLTNLGCIEIENAVISEIQARSFVGLESLRDFGITYTHVGMIKPYAFQNIGSVTLYVRNSTIDTIEKNAFSYADFSFYRRQVALLENVEIKNLKAGAFINYGLGHLNNEHPFILRISNGELTELGAHHFEGLEALEQLYLQDNRIKYIDRLAFFDLKHLTRLNISNNSLENVGVIFEELAELSFLDLSFNLISMVSYFTGLERLEVLKLNNNRIKEFKSGIFDSLSQLRELDLRSNQIANLENELFSKLHSLAHLSVPFNKITTIDWSPVSNQKNLTQFGHLNVYLLKKDCPNLKYIDLSYNEIPCSKMKRILKIFDRNRIDFPKSNNRLFLDTSYGCGNHEQSLTSNDRINITMNHDDSKSRHLAKNFTKDWDKKIKSFLNNLSQASSGYYKKASACVGLLIVVFILIYAEKLITILRKCISVAKGSTHNHSPSTLELTNAAI